MQLEHNFNRQLKILTAPRIVLFDQRWKKAADINLDITVHIFVFHVMSSRRRFSGLRCLRVANTVHVCNNVVSVSFTVSYPHTVTHKALGLFHQIGYW